MKPKITDIYCYYTGGGIYIYSAKYGDNYLYGTLDQTIDIYTIRGEVLFQDESSCEFLGLLDEMKAYTAPADPFVCYVYPDDVEYPTWKDILDSLHSGELIAEGCADAEETLCYWNPDLTKRTCEE